MENPPGRLWRGDWRSVRDHGPGLVQALGKPAYVFDPWEFGALDGTRNTKRTYLWGDFTPPVKSPHPSGRGGDRTSQLSSRKKRRRARTPSGFAQAFFEANP